MWSKFVTLVLTALFIAAVGSPVMSHDGKVSALIDSEQDEQPWGGEHNYNPPTPPFEAYPDPGQLPGGFYFIQLTVDYGWTSIRSILIGVLDYETNSGKTGSAQTLEQTPGETTTQDQGMGTR